MLRVTLGLSDEACPDTLQECCAFVFHTIIGTLLAGQGFFDGPVLEVAPRLLGAVISHDGVAVRVAGEERAYRGRRIVLSYLSIGEAEKYRYYWKWYWGWLFGWFAPAWRDRQNTEWRGNYAVRYWEPSWQDIIFAGNNSYLDRIIKAGFVVGGSAGSGGTPQQCFVCGCGDL